MSFFDMLLAQKLSGNGGGGGAALDYSTNEQATGVKWIDGKEIYCITYDRHDNPVSGETGVADVSPLRIENLVDAAVTVSYSTGQVTCGTGGRGVFTNGDTLVYASNGQTGVMIYCTIWYTKLES